MMIWFVAIVALIMFVFVSVDLCVAINEWQSRIHIGKWHSRDEWKKAVLVKVSLWIKDAPTVRVTEQNRLVLWDMLCGNYRSKTIQRWQDAGLLIGGGEAVCAIYCKKHKGLFTQKEFMPEDILLAYALKKNGFLDKRIEEKILERYKEYKDVGTLCYRSWVGNIRFVDTLGMIIPFFHACGWDDLVKRQIEEYDEALLAGVYPAHAYDMDKGLPLGVFDWARGFGWYILALIETVDIQGHDKRIMRLSEALLKHQRNDGGYSCFVFNKRERMESSGTVLIGILFLTAYKLSKEARFLDAAKKIERALMGSTRRDGALDYCQGDTNGIGYYSRIFSVMPFAQGLMVKLSKQLDTYMCEGDGKA